MQDRSDRYQVHNAQTLNVVKKIGSYLSEAGLLTADQINVALNDQQSTGMRFGEIVVARGWVKEQTVEWIMNKVVEPERRALKRQEQVATRWNPGSKSSQAAPTKPLQGVPTPTAQSAPAKPAASKAYVRREVPISKPLPSVSSSDGDVNWVG